MTASQEIHHGLILLNLEAIGGGSNGVGPRKVLSGAGKAKGRRLKKMFNSV